MTDLAAELDSLAASSGFSGVFRVDREGEVVERAYGFADRRWHIPNTATTRFAIASGVKGLTALVVVSLVEEGVLEIATTARSILGDDLPLIDDAVTVEQLVAHRSGIGDYFDEDLPGEITDYALPVPVHTLADTEDYVSVLDGFPAKFAPDEQFSYCNGGFVVLALVSERVSGVPFHELVVRRVCEPAGMADTAFLRADELPGALRSATSTPTDSAPTCCTSRCVGPATVASTRRRSTFAASGRRSSRGGSSRTNGCAR